MLFLPLLLFILLVGPLSPPVSVVSAAGTAAKSSTIKSDNTNSAQPRGSSAASSSDDDDKDDDDDNNNNDDNNKAPLLLLPRDVIYDKSARSALETLRGSKRDEDEQEALSNNDDNKVAERRTLRRRQEEAEQELSTSGNRERLTLTLIGYKGGAIQDQVNQDRAFVHYPLVELPQGNNENVDVATTTESGNEDATRTLTPLLFMGVMDGHGPAGHHVAEFARQDLAARLSRGLLQVAREEDAAAARTTNERASNNKDDANNNATTSTVVSDLIKTCFIETDKALPSQHAEHGGATASVALQWGSKLFMANAGDSQSMVVAVYPQQSLVAGGGSNPQDAAGSSKDSSTDDDNDESAASSPFRTEILYATRLDKPDHPLEKARILEAGGYVTEASDEDDARVYYEAADGQQWGLAMSRGLGDWGAKAVIAEPLVDVLDLRDLAAALVSETDKSNHTTSAGASPQQQQACTATTRGNSDSDQTCEARLSADGTTDENAVQLFVVSASDGVIDYVPPEEIAQILGPSLYAYDPDAKSSSTRTVYHPLTAAEMLIHTSARRWHRDNRGQHRDDIAIAVAKLQFDYI